MHIAILTFQGFNELDSLVALGVLNRVERPGWRVTLCCPEPTVTSMNGVIVHAQSTLEVACAADAVLVGSGTQTRQVVETPSLMARFALDPSRQLIAAQCSGTLILARSACSGGSRRSPTSRPSPGSSRRRRGAQPAVLRARQRRDGRRLPLRALPRCVDYRPHRRDAGRGGRAPLRRAGRRKGGLRRPCLAERTAIPAADGRAVRRDEPACWCVSIGVNVFARPARVPGVPPLNGTLANPVRSMEDARQPGDTMTPLGGIKNHGRFVTLVATRLLANAALAADPIVTVETGTLRGGTSGGIDSFKGVPFAAPPVGDLRWRRRSPRRPGPERDATPGACAMPAGDSSCHHAARPESRTASPSTSGCPGISRAQSLPVMVWIHGGGSCRLRHAEAL